MISKYTNCIKWSISWFVVWYLLAIASYKHISTISQLGNARASVVQYSIALIGSAYFLWQASNEMAAQSKLKAIAVFTKVFALLSALIVFLPYKINPVIFWIHMSISGIMAVCSLIISFKLALFLRSRLGYLICTSQVIALFMMIYTFPFSQDSLLWRMQFIYELVMIFSVFAMLFLASRLFLPILDKENSKK